MKPAKSIFPSIAGSPTKNACILITSPIVNPRLFRFSSIRFSTLTVWVSVSPYASMLPLGASGLLTPGTAPLRKTIVLVAGTSDARRMGKSEPIRPWRITDSFASGLASASLHPAVANTALSKSGANINFFILCSCILSLSNGFNVVGTDGVGKVVTKVTAGVIHHFGDLFVRQVLL